MINLKEYNYIKNNRQKIGNKSFNLSFLKYKKFLVPEGFIVFQKEFNKIMFQDFNLKNISIRSAALGEDGKSSFAGIFNSALNVTEKNFQIKLKEVVDSFSSKRAQAYTRIKDISFTPQILIQGMIDSQSSAVVFIEKNNIFISFQNGLCENIVSGKSNSIEINLNLKNINNIFDKKYQIPLKEKFIQNILEINNLFSLSDKLDIEMTFNGENWYILQVRELNF